MCALAQLLGGRFQYFYVLLRYSGREVSSESGVKFYSKVSDGGGAAILNIMPILSKRDLRDRSQRIGNRGNKRRNATTRIGNPRSLHVEDIFAIKKHYG